MAAFLNCVVPTMERALCPAGDSDSWKRMDDVYAAINKDSQCLFALGSFTCEAMLSC